MSEGSEKNEQTETRGPADQLARLIALERQARRCETSRELIFTIVNWTHRLIPYYQALYFRVRGNDSPVLEAVSAVATVDTNTPFALWATTLCRLLLKKYDKTQALAEQKEFAAAIREEWQQWLPEHVLYCPLLGRDNTIKGVLILAREHAYLPQELSMAEVLSGAYAHAISAFSGKKSYKFFNAHSKKARSIGIGIALTVIALLFLIRIHESVLAPAEIIPLEPTIVTSPVRGMIRDIDVHPYQMVQQGQLLFHLDNTELINQLALAQKNLQVVQADYLRAEQKSFSDPLSKAELEVFRVQIEEKALIVQYTQEELERQRITAQQGGMVLFNDRNDWIGRPVAVGEKVMTLANPSQAEILIRMPVDDAITLDPGAKVKLFLRTDPLNPVDAEISRTSFKAEESKSGGMYFPLKAKFVEGKDPRIGLQGTAKLFGEKVSLFYYIFRKPLAVIRREVGL